MNPRIPDLEFFIVIKWMVIVVFSAGLAQLSSLWIKQKWYGSEKHDRRSDPEETRGWIERFLEIQQQYTEATIALGNQIHGLGEQMQRILSALEKNGDTIAEFTRSAECKFEPKHNKNGHDR